MLLFSKKGAADIISLSAYAYIDTRLFIILSSSLTPTSAFYNIIQCIIFLFPSFIFPLQPNKHYFLERK